MAESRDYWAKRAVRREEESARQGGAIARKALRHYRQAVREIQTRIEVFCGRYAAGQGIRYEEAVKVLRGTAAKEWAKTLGEYVEEINALPDSPVKERLKAELDARAYSSRITRLDALKAQIDMEIDRMMVLLEQEMEEGFGSLYTEGYYRKMFDIQQHTGKMFDFARLDRNMVEKALSYPWSGADFSARLWENKRALLFHLRETVTQGAIQGKGAAELSKGLSDKMGQSYKVAERLIRTESNHFHTAADMDAYQAAGVRQYEFLATLDSRTSEVCAGLDGKFFPVEEAQAGVNCPPMHPNCRSCTVEYDPEEQRDWEAIGQPMPERMTYQEWAAEQGIHKPALTQEGKSPTIELTEMEQWAVNEYVSSGSYKLNAPLRAGIPLTEEQRELMQYLDSALEKMPVYQGIVYRSINISDLQSFWEEHAVGEEVTYYAYTSSSTEVYDGSMTIQMTIESKTARDLRRYNPGEQEILFPRGCEFKIFNREGNHLWLREI